MENETNFDLLNDMAEDAEIVKREIPRTEKLKELSTLCEKMLKHQERIEQISSELNKETEEYNKINQLLIPDLFDELGLKKIALSDGKSVEVKLKYTANITEENSEQCFDWLRKNNHDAIIKHKIDIDLKKGEKKEYEELLKILLKLGVTYKDKNMVHPQTLYAFVREQIEGGKDFPKELFKVYPLRSTKIN